jgi:hypothetical protein
VQQGAQQEVLQQQQRVVVLHNRGSLQDQIETAASCSRRSLASIQRTGYCARQGGGERRPFSRNLGVATLPISSRSGRQ